MKEYEKVLEELGLSKLESQLYLKLLKIGPSSAGNLAKELNIQRSTAYYLLENLKKKNFIFVISKEKNKLFQATDPNIFEEHSYNTYLKIKELVPNLLTIKAFSKKENEEISIFTGYAGLKTAYEQMLIESEDGDEFLVLGARGGEDIASKTYKLFYIIFNKKRIEKNITQRIIMNYELKDKIGKYYETLEKTEVKYLKQKTYVPIVIFPNAVAILQWKEEPSLLLLRGKLYVDSFRQYFNSMWEITKK